LQWQWSLFSFLWIIFISFAHFLCYSGIGLEQCLLWCFLCSEATLGWNGAWFIFIDLVRLLPLQDWLDSIPFLANGESSLKIRSNLFKKRKR
jgi:hypothetical protein